MSASVLPAFPCPHCEARAFHKLSVACTSDSADVVQAMAHLYVCHACGENYLATVQVERDGTRVETWDYYLERDVAMRRVRRYQATGPYGLAEVDPLFVVDGCAVSEAAWRDALAAVRTADSPLVETAPDALIARWRALWARPVEVTPPSPLRLVIASDASAMPQRRSA